MRILIASFLFLTQFSFAQLNLSINQIDSICKVTRNKVESSAIIQNNKDKIIGSSNITLFKNLDSNLIKGEYFEETKQKKSFSYTYFAEYYYQKSTPFFLKLKITRTDSKRKEEELIVELDQEELNSNVELKNEFLLNLRKKMNEMNTQILELSKNVN